MQMLLALALLPACWAFDASADPVSLGAAMDTRVRYGIELESLFQTLRTNYAPLELKRETIGLDVRALKRDALNRASALTNSAGFHFLFADVLNSLNDAHVSVQLPSTRTWQLPLQMSAVEGAIIVNYIDRALLPEAKCPVHPGDRLLTINGRPPAELQASNPVYRKYGNDRTNLSMFARMLSGLSESRGVPLDDRDEPKVMLQFERDGATLACEMTYKTKGLGLIGREIPPVSGDLLLSRKLRQSLLRSEMTRFAPATAAESADKGAEWHVFPRVDQWIERWQGLFNLASGIESVVADTEETPAKSEGRKLAVGMAEPVFKLPKSFHRIQPFFPVRKLLNADSFYAGVFKHKGKRVGYLRVPSYMAQLPATLPFSIRYYVSKLEKKSDLLILDQSNNPGGMVVMSDLLVEGLVGKLDQAKHMRFAMKPTQNFLRQFAQLIELLEKDMGGMEKAAIKLPPGQKEAFLSRLRGNYELVRRAFVEDRALSEPVDLAVMSELIEAVIDAAADKISFSLKAALETLSGTDLFGHPVYTKPVFMLTNELDFSGADATPAILQDYGRARLVGVRTAGAGGTVEEFASFVTSNIKFRLTTSLMVRSTGKLVENYGVQPDIAFELTARDYREGFENTLPRLLDVIGL